MDAAPRTERASLRTPNDVSALCVELLRAVREQEFRARHRGGPAPSVDRAWRAWRADLDRYGPLQLVADGDGLRAGGGGPPVGRGRLDELGRRLRERVLASVRFEPGLDAPTWAAFVSLLVADPGEVERHGGPAGFLPERGVGIRLLDPDEKPDEEEAEANARTDVGTRGPVAHEAAAPDPDGIEIEGAEAPDDAEIERSDAPGDAAISGAAGDADIEGPDVLDAPDDGDVALLDPDDEELPDVDRDAPPAADGARAAELEGETTLRLGLTPGASTLPMGAGLLAAPCGAGPGDAPPGSALAALWSPTDDAPYAQRVARAVAEAAAWSRAGDAEACYRTVLALGAQARDRDGLERPERAAARGGLRELCTGRVLTDLIARATDSDRDASLQASRVLIQLGEQAAPELLAAIEAEHDPGRREELVGIAIALGRPTTPALHRAMEGASPDRARIAARIAGEIRDERAVPTLSKLLDHKRAEVRGESARALARIGNVMALMSLKRGLASPHEDVQSLCAYCLGVTGTSEAAEALTETLREARRARRTQLASAVIRSLGRLGREESVPELKRLIEKRSFFRRQEIRELKLQAIGALAKLPGERARAVLEAVAGGSDMGLAVAARRALKERGEAAG